MMLSKRRDCRPMKCTTVLHGGVCNHTSIPHKSGTKIKEQKRSVLEAITLRAFLTDCMESGKDGDEVEFFTVDDVGVVCCMAGGASFWPVRM